MTLNAVPIKIVTIRENAITEDVLKHVAWLSAESMLSVNQHTTVHIVHALLGTQEILTSSALIVSNDKEPRRKWMMINWNCH